MAIHRKLTTIAAIAVLAFGLAACGGGGDSPQTGKEPTPQEQQHSQVTSAIGMATAAIGALTDMSSDADVAAAQGLIDAAQTALAGTTALTSQQALALQGQITAAQTSLNGVKMQIADRIRNDHDAEYNTAKGAVDAATAAVGDLTAMSSDADVEAAQAAIAAAEAAVAATTMLTADEVAELNAAIAGAKTDLGDERKAIVDYREHQRQYGIAMNAVTAAQTAVAGLSAASNDADVAAAQAAVGAARVALAGTTALTAEETLQLNGAIDTAETSLNSAISNIADRKTHDQQLQTARNAADAATTAVAGLSAMSSDADVTAAEGAISMAKAAVAAGTMLTDSEKSELGVAISAAETSLDGMRMQIADYRTHKSQVAAANTAVDAAETAVAGLTAMSTQADVDAAQDAIDAAEAAVAAGTLLTDGEKASLRGKIAIAKVDLGEKKTQIADNNTHQDQLKTATDAANAAKMAVAGLTATSSDADVTAAEEAITAAKAAVTAGTMLTDSEKAGLNGTIDAAETSLGAVKTLIADRKDLDLQKTIVRLHGEASGAIADATAAGKSADQALKDAKKYADMLGTGGVFALGTAVIKADGDSEMVESSAQKVLDANKAAEDAAGAASDAKTRAQTAKTEATGIADGTPGKDALIAALDTAIDTAEAEIKATTEVRDGDPLEDHVETVTGTAKKKETPASRGKRVADTINTALTTSAQVTITGTFPSNHTTNATTGDLVMGPSDAQGRTWAQIGGSALMDFRIAAGSGDNAATRTVKAKSVAGMTVNKVYDPENLPGSAPGTTNGTEIDSNIKHMGIDGVLFCAGSDCKVENVVADTFAATSKLTGSWYFAPDAGATTTYIEGAGDAAGTYTVEGVTSYVRYGYWLSVNSASAGVTTINRYVGGPSAQAGDVYGVNNNVPAFAGTSASYKGDALGMAVKWTTDTKGKEVAGSRASGGFTADVSLTMSFPSASLKGTISNFQGTGADSSWSVDLDSQTFSSGTFDNGVTDGGDAKGAWTATAWGGAESNTDQTPNPAARPTGVFGGFTADFTNGAAAGVYATRKQ